MSGTPDPFDPFRADPERAAILTDFDGTLSAIVDDPATAVPVEGARDALSGLAGRFGMVAVVSGRPASFLAERIGGIPGLVVVGLYGLERLGADGTVTSPPGVATWRAPVSDAVDRLTADAPPGIEVESKGLAVTVHWRRAPEAAGWVPGAVAEVAAATGLDVHPGRASLELRPPLPVDKGSVVEELAAGFAAACFLGDDLGDLAAFAALGRLAARDGMTVVRVAVTDAECAPEVVEAADVRVDGPAGALALLAGLARAPGG